MSIAAMVMRFQGRRGMNDIGSSEAGRGEGSTRRGFIAAATPLLVAGAASAARGEAVGPAGSEATRSKPATKRTGTRTMRALFAGGGGPPHFRSVATPRIESGVEAIVRPLTVALCDLDVPYIANVLPMQHPYAVGHEFTAEVVEVGDAVRTLKTGDRVTVPFQISCGSCSRCRSARSLDCVSVEPLSTYGLEPFGGGAGWGGAMADLVRIPFADAMAMKLAHGMDLVSVAALSDNIADGYRCIGPHTRPGQDVLVIGSASVGLYAVAFAKALAVPCTYVDNDERRLQVAERLGAKVISALPDGRSFGEFAVTASCNSTPGGLQSAIRSTTGGGICQVAGLHFQPAAVPLLDMYKRGIHLVASRANVRDDLPPILDLIHQDRFHPGDIGASVIRLDDAPEALKGRLSYKTVIQMT
jgi:threonine dehydrogenase-like Zn-dependent dehydrogenase